MTVHASDASPLRHSVLEAAGVHHGFGVRGAPEPVGVLRPRQVHGRTVARAASPTTLAPRDADAVVSTLSGVPVAVVTADCVPVLAASQDGMAVAAIHAGWRGLAVGVVQAGIESLRACCPSDVGLCAVVGPHIGPCCYEVDAPVLEALELRFGTALERGVQPGRPGHAQLDLAALVAIELERGGVSVRDVIANPCTRCDAARFHSYRRDGEGAGRLLHFVTAS